MLGKRIYDLIMMVSSFYNISAVTYVHWRAGIIIFDTFQEQESLERLVVIANLEVQIKALDDRQLNLDDTLDHTSTPAANSDGHEFMSGHLDDEIQSEILNTNTDTNTTACSDILESAANPTIINNQEVGTNGLIDITAGDSCSSEKGQFIASVDRSPLHNMFSADADSTAPAVTDLSLSLSASNREQRVAAYVSRFEQSTLSHRESELESTVVAAGPTYTDIAGLKKTSNDIATRKREMRDDNSNPRAHIDMLLAVAGDGEEDSLSTMNGPCGSSDFDATATLFSEDEKHNETDELTHDGGPPTADAVPIIGDDRDVAPVQVQVQAAVPAPAPAPAGLFPEFLNTTYLEHASVFLFVVLIEYFYFIFCFVIPALTGRGILHVMNVRHTALCTYVMAGLHSWAPDSTLLHMPLTADDAARWQLLLFRLEHFLGAALLCSVASLVGKKT